MNRLWFFVLVFIWPAILDAQRLWNSQKPLRKNAALFDSNESQAELLRERLPRVVNVSRYELVIFPHFPFLGLYQEKPDFTFDGTVRIHFTIAKTTQNIWLFAQNLLEFSSVQLSKEDGGSIPIDSFVTTPNITRLTLKTVVPLRVGQKCILKIDYKGPINEYGDAGLYFSKYMDDGGDFQYLIGTFFEPMRARKMYPSFDDPYFKATFQLSVVYPKLAKVYSNVAEGKNHEYNKNYNMMEFAASKRMSSYLLAFVIGNFKSALAKTKRGVPVQTIAIPELADYLPASAQIGANCIDGMEKLVNVDYPLNKLDNVEMIEMGHSSAMENFGLIVYTRFLSQLPIATPSPMRVSQTVIMCHEISHQWFGDLVTADRWGYEFLHESFAAFFQNRATQQFRTDQKDFIESVMVWNKNAGLHSQKEIEHAVVADRAYFDDVTYDSGGAILRMFERVLGSDNFFKALNRYLTKHQFSNAKADDLIDEFVAVIDKPLCGNMDARKIFDGFLKNSHYPIVDIWIEDNKYMFSVYPSRTDSTANWTVPIFAYNLRTGEESVGYLLEDGRTCPESWVNASDSYIFNHKSTTFARVTYSETLWDQLLKMDTTKIEETTLLGLITDVMDFEDEQYAIAKWKSTRLFKKIVADSRGKVSPHIVQAILTRFLSVRNFFSTGDGLDLYSHLLQSHFTSIYNQLDWTSSDWAAGHINYLLLPAAVKFNIGDARKKAKELFKQFTVDCSAFNNFETCNKIQADARTAAYCAGVIDNEQDSVTFLTNYWHQLIRGRKTFFYFQYEMEAVANGLACVTNQTQLENLLETAVYQNETNFINSLAFNAEASTVLYNFITNNVNLFNRHLQMLSNALSSMISTWSKDEDMDKLLTLIASIQDKLPDDAKQIFSDVILALGNNIKRGKQVIPQYTRYIYDDTVIIQRAAWTKELANLNINNINYKFTFTPYYPTTGYVIDQSKFFTFDGHVIVTFTTTKATQQIQINSHRQLINFVQVSTSSGLVNAKTSRDYENGILTLDLENLVAAKSRVMIEIGFMGLIFDKLADSIQGVNFYESYNTKTEEVSSILYTELAGGANPRSLVPCFDEPKYKATWDITVRHPSIFTALSNGVILSHELDSFGYSTTKFSQTKPMSTYIVAIAIGKFGSLSGVTPDGIPVRVWARLGYELYAKVALEAAINTINYLSQEMKESYKQFGTKLDILAAPLYAGAMENWGLIIGKEEYVLHNSEVQALENKQNVYRVMSHETVHHWFGDLVTTKDWYNTFVSEGFATFFESEIFGHYFGNAEKFRFTSSEAALRYDEKVQARIIPSDVNVDGFEPFSPIPSSVMQMLRSFVGDDVFKSGLQNYIAARAFRNADDATLWSYITQAAQAKQITGWDGELLDVQQFMDPFFKQTSYPVLSVYTPENTGLVNVKQSSFYDPSTLPKSDFDYRWFIPITWVYDSKNNETDWVYKEIFDQIPFKSAAWLTMGRITYARVKYDDKVWSEVVKNLVNNTRYNDTVWASIVTDNWALANSGQVKWDRLLETLQHLKYTNGELTWRYGFEIFDNLISRLKTTPAFGKLKKLIADAINDRGNYGNSDYWNYNNGNSFITKLAARLQIGKFVDVAKSFMDHGGSDCVSSPYGIHRCLNVFISPDNRAQFLCSGIQTYKNLKPKMEAVLDNLNEKNNAFLAASVDPLIEMVSCLQDEKETQKYLTFSVEGYYYGFADLFIQRLAHLDMTNTYLYNWLMSKSDKYTNLGLLHQSEQFSNFVQAMTKDWATSDFLNQFNAIKWQVLDNKRADVVKNAANKIRSNIQWQSDNYDAIFQWLNKNY